jgi:6-pyruvoyltetrahydropterin/6-carboxytetrahydropterin synthase
LSAAENVAVFGKCNHGGGHGHNYKLTVTLYGPVDAVTGMVVNLVDVGVALRAILATVDHRNLDIDVPYFRDNSIVSTAENLAVFFWRALSQFPTLAPILHTVRIDETDKNSAWCRGDDDGSVADVAKLKGLEQFGTSTTVALAAAATN